MATPPQKIKLGETMSRNGSGVYSLPPGSTVVDGDASSASDVNVPMADVEADLNVARPIVAGGTGATSASAARTALGVRIGVNVQAHDDILDELSALVVGSNQNIYTDPDGDLDSHLLTAFGRTLLGHATAALVRTELELGTAATRAMSFDADYTVDGNAISPRYLVKSLVDEVPGVVAVIEDQASIGTAPQTTTADTWTQRNLSTVVYNPDSRVALASNRFTPTIDCFCEWSAPGRGKFQTRLYNVTDSVLVKNGTVASASSGDTALSTGGAPLVAGKQYRIDHICDSTLSAGVAGSFTQEVYTRVKLLRVGS